MANKTLGKGLGALVAETTQEAGNKEITTVLLSQLTPHKGQPRKRFEKKDLEELTQSIKQHGVLQPLLVRPHGRGYEIIAGERRYQASKKAGLKQVPVLIQDIADEDILPLALIENLQRADLNPIEEAQSYGELMTEGGLTQAQIADLVSKSRPAIANALRLLELPKDVQELLQNAKLSSGHARALLSLPTKQDQSFFAREMAKNKLSVRQAEELVRQKTNKKAAKEKKDALDKEKAKTAHRRTLESSLSDILDVPVRVVQRAGKGRGTISIEFANEKELRRIVSKIG